MQLTYSVLTNPQFRMGLQQLGAQRLPMRVAYRLGKWITEVQAAVEKIQKGYEQEILSQFAAKNPDGTYQLTNPGDPASHIIPDENRPKIEAANAEYGARLWEIHQPKIFLEDLGEALEIQPAIFAALDPILTEREQGEGSDQVEAPTPLKAVPNP